VAVKEAPDRARRERGSVLVAEQCRELDQCDVYLSLNGSQDHVAIRLDAMRAQIAALRQGFGSALGTPGANPTDGTRYRNAETLRRPVARHPAINNRNHAITKVLR
jgi:hypothetical protein